MMNDQPTNVQTTQVTEGTYVIITPVIPEGQQQSSSVSSGFVSNMLNPRPDIGIDSIFNTEATSLVDVPVTTIVEPPLVSATTLPLPPTPLITHMQQTPVPTPTTVPSSSLQDLTNFGSLFGIVDAYLANKMHEAVKTAVQLQSDKLRDEALAENEAFLNSLDNNIKKIIKDQVKQQVKAQVSKILLKIKKTVNEQLEAEVMTRSSTESKTSLDIAANLSELELKKILIQKMERNKRRDDEDKDKEPSAGPNWGSKRRRARKELESTSAPKEWTNKTTGKSTNGSKLQKKSAGEDKDLEEPAHQEFDIGATEEQSDEETSQHPDWFQKPVKPPTPDRDWNKTLPAVHGPIQPWLSNLAQEEGPRESFDELMDTPLDFSGFMMNRLKIDTLTPELLAGPTFELMKGQQYPHDLRKPLPLIPNSHCRQVIPFDHFINNDIVYLSGGVSSRTYATSITKTKVADYGHIKWIKDLVPNTIWSEVSVNYDKYALWGISHWGRKRQQFYGFAVNKESARDVYSKRRIIAFTKLQIVEWRGYKHLDWITIRKLINLNVEDRLAFGVSLRMFTRSIVIQRRVEDLQLAYSNPRGFIYQNKDKKNKLMRIDELYKFSDGTLDDVRTSLNDRLKGIRMEYLPKSIWRQNDRERAKAMIQAIDKQFKSRRIIRSLENFLVLLMIGAADSRRVMIHSHMLIPD
ncbi:hypothetical protein Tco_0012826 [Tanacetum coccineum]